MFTRVISTEITKPTNSIPRWGQGDLAMVLLLLDSGMQVSELCGIDLGNLRQEGWIVKILGKGNKERLIPVGKQVQKLLWHYINRFRLQPMSPGASFCSLVMKATP